MDIHEALAQFGSPPFYPGLERLIAAAATDSHVATLLVTNTAEALVQLQSTVRLSSIEYAIALSIDDATDIVDFVARLYAKARQVAALPNLPDDPS